jgi:hypothetical protein
MPVCFFVFHIGSHTVDLCEICYLLLLILSARCVLPPPVRSFYEPFTKSVSVDLLLHSSVPRPYPVQISERLRPVIAVDLLGHGGGGRGGENLVLELCSC